MSINTEVPRLYSGFFDPLTAEGSKDSFHKRYKHLKKRCHCHTLKQVVNISDEHLNKVEDVDDLKKVLAGLMVVREKYPTCSRWKQIFKKFNKQFRETEEANIKRLDSTIVAYAERIEELSKNPPQQKSGSLLQNINGKVIQIFATQDPRYDNVKKLLESPEFVSRAQAIVESMANVSSLPAEEVIRIWGAKMGGLVQICPKDMSATDVHLAMLLGAKEHSPKLIQRMAKLKERDPGLVLPLISNQALEGASAVFRQLAMTVELAIGEKKAAELDLLNGRYAEGQYDVFQPYQVPAEVIELLHEFPDLLPDIRLLIVKMGADLSESTPEAALKNLKDGVYSIFDRQEQIPVDDESGLMMEVYSINSEKLALFIEALVVRMAKDDFEDVFSAFALVFETCLKQSGELDKGTQSIVDLFTAAFKKYAEVDLTGEKPGKMEAVFAEGTEVKPVKPPIKGWDMVFSQMNLGHKMAVSDMETLRKQRDTHYDVDKFRQVVTELIKGKPAGSLMEAYPESLDAKDGNQMMKWLGAGCLIVGNRPFYDDPNSLDQMDLNTIMFAIYKDNPEYFSSLVAQISQVDPEELEGDKAFYEKLCRAVDFTTGVDPRLIKIEDDQVSFVEPKRREVDPEVLEANLMLLNEQNQWLSKLDEKDPPKGVEAYHIEGAKSDVHIHEYSSFKEKVEAFLSDYIELKSPIGTEGKRRYFNLFIHEFKEEYGREYVPGKGGIGQDEFMAFMLAVMAVNPKAGSLFLESIAQEDAEVIWAPSGTDEYLYMNASGLVDTVGDETNFILKAFREHKGSPADEIGNPEEIDERD